MRTVHLGRLGTFAVFTTLLLGACGSSGGSSGASSSASSASGGATPAAASSTATTSGTATAGVTKPGTGLTVGQTATVTYTPLTSSGNGKPRTLKITVASLRTGSSADLKGIDLSGAPKGAVPQYATVTVTNVGPLSIDVDGTSDAIQGIDHGGNQQDPVSFIGDFPACNQNSSTTPVAAGASFHTCLTYLVPGGITRVGWTGTDDYTSSPVTWSGS
jgi:ABC-type Fe3+-hydroxamate transport system substrate-binding protein